MLRATALICECFSHLSVHSLIGCWFHCFQQTRTWRGVCVPHAYHNEDTSRVDVLLAAELIAQIVLHNAGSGTHKLAYVQLLGLGKWHRQVCMSRQLLE